MNRFANASMLIFIFIFVVASFAYSKKQMPKSPVKMMNLSKIEFGYYKTLTWNFQTNKLLFADKLSITDDFSVIDNYYKVYYVKTPKGFIYKKVEFYQKSSNLDISFYDPETEESIGVKTEFINGFWYHCLSEYLFDVMKGKNYLSKSIWYNNNGSYSIVVTHSPSQKVDSISYYDAYGTFLKKVYITSSEIVKLDKNPPLIKQESQENGKSSLKEQLQKTSIEKTNQTTNKAVN